MNGYPVRPAARLRRIVAASLIALAGVAHAGNTGFTTLMVGAEPVRIYRDDFGVPHIFANSNRDLFEAYGFVVAQDRLWQLDVNRRAARGMLAEFFGSDLVNTDRSARTHGYTNAELDGIFNALPADQREIFEAYRDGINRYVAQVIAPDPFNKMPFEHLAQGLAFAPWTTRDSIAFAIFMIRRFGEIGGRELTNLAVLNHLIGLHGAINGRATFDDVRWVNDPDSPVTVPITGATGKRHTKTPPFNGVQLLNSPTDPDPSHAQEALDTWEALGVPTKLGSYAWLVSQAKSANGFAMLYGGPQMGFSAPEVIHEVQLKNNQGFNVAGMAFSGVPLVLIGRNEHVAWTSTTATGDNVDHYALTLCDAGGGAGSGYMFNGACVAFDTRVEAINVRGGAPVNHPVQRSVHGPIVASVGGVAYAYKRAHWMREMMGIQGFLGFNLARNINHFEAAVMVIPTSHNFLYADKQGNIAYWSAGQVPVRPAGFDSRIPFPGDGTAEWPGGYLPVPKSINPAQGWLANWNNKPSVDYDNADNQSFGKQFRLREIDDRLRSGGVTLEMMRDIPKDIARVGGIGREARFLLPHLLAALGSVPPSHPLGAQAKAVLQAWDRNAFANAVSSTTLQAGEIIFRGWMARMIANTFADELTTRVGEANANTLLHVLDQAMTGSSGVPPSRDYLNSVNPRNAMSAAFDQVLTTLQAQQGGNPNTATWTAPRPVTNFVHVVLGNVGSIPTSNRSTYAQIVVMSRPKAYAENIITLGQSGFAKFVPPGSFALDPHFRDQLPLYREFRYKPMPLYLNTQLKE